MLRGSVSSQARLALLAAAGLAMGGLMPAQAADLGGSCCADLEERIAELEATTARKGNRKVSLTIPGWVNEAVFWWDDGQESNTYVGTNSLEQDRFSFTGEAKIDGDWSAGYRLEIGINGAASNQFSQDSPDGVTPNTLTTRHAHWFLKSKTYGKLAVGLNGTATYHLLDDADAANTRNYDDAEAAPVALAQFKIRVNGAFVNNLQWRDILEGVNNDTPGQNGRRNVVRYDSPDFWGFVLTASWGEDDMGGVALTYKNEFHDFKVLAKAGYEETSDSFNPSFACNPNNTAADMDCNWWGVAGTIMYTPRGLYVYAGYGELNDDSRDNIPPTADSTDTTWFIQAGIEQKWCPLGKTTVYAMYRHDNPGSNVTKLTNSADADTFVQEGDFDFWSGGVVQNIENAAMDLYVIYRHSEGDFTNGAGTNFDLDDFDMVISGARIQF